MLRALAIRNFVVVEALDLDLPSGFSVLTGETGAGKSILIDALALALGERNDGPVVRPGAERADILVSLGLELHELDVQIDRASTELLDLRPEAVQLRGDLRRARQRIRTRRGRICTLALFGLRPSCDCRGREVGRFRPDTCPHARLMPFLCALVHSQILTISCSRGMNASSSQRTKVPWKG